MQRFNLKNAISRIPVLPGSAQVKWIKRLLIYSIMSLLSHIFAKTTCALQGYGSQCCDVFETSYFHYLWQCTVYCVYFLTAGGDTGSLPSNRLQQNTGENISPVSRHRTLLSNTVCILVTSFLVGWFGSRVVSVLDSGAERPGFKSQSRRCRVTVLGKLFTPIVPLFSK